MRVFWTTFVLAALAIWSFVQLSVVRSTVQILEQNINQNADILVKPTKYTETSNHNLSLGPVKLDTNQTNTLFAFQQGNLKGGNHHCGAQKCFFPLQIDNHYGYVAGVGRSLFSAMAKAHKLALDIENKYHLEQINVRPPQLIPPDQVPSDFRSWLDANKVGPNGLPPRKEKDTPAFRDKNGPIAVQLVKTVPDDGSTIFWAAFPNKLHIGWQKIDQWLTQLMSSEDSATFLQVFSKDVQNFRLSLQEHHYLWYDLQLYIRNSGHILQFDVDRQFDKNKVLHNKETNLHLLEAFVQYLTQVVQNGRVPPMLEWQKPENTYLIHGPTDQLWEMWNFTTNVVQGQFHLQNLYLGQPKPHSNDPAISSMAPIDTSNHSTAQQPSFSAVSFGCFGNQTQQLAEVTERLSSSHHGYRGVSKVDASKSEIQMRRLHNFELSLARIHSLMDHHKCLFKDFEVLIQTNGEVIPANIEACFDEKKKSVPLPRRQKSETKGCINGLAKHVESLFLQKAQTRSSNSAT